MSIITPTKSWVCGRHSMSWEEMSLEVLIYADDTNKDWEGKKGVEG